ncbi:hypothetical protein CDAR_257081 [Caerostris darwini]|uniref:Uncharacterized protein n=1 Tax=Caerostris darwini TaxID=1538125 RepID=A0AAV4Q0T1_9ARAC|nr:hypothetical protein CDAR_257081 [Caerostris darwini]
MLSDLISSDAVIVMLKRFMAKRDNDPALMPPNVAIGGIAKWCPACLPSAHSYVSTNSLTSVKEPFRDTERRIE